MTPPEVPTMTLPSDVMPPRASLKLLPARALSATAPVAGVQRKGREDWVGLEIAELAMPSATAPSELMAVHLASGSPAGGSTRTMPEARVHRKSGEPVIAVQDPKTTSPSELIALASEEERSGSWRSHSGKNPRPTVPICAVQ